MSTRIDEEEFNIWLENPVTMWVFQKMMEKSEECTQRWVAESMGNGNCSSELLADLRARQDVLRGITESTFEDFGGVVNKDQLTMKIAS